MSIILFYACFWHYFYIPFCIDELKINVVGLLFDFILVLIIYLISILLLYFFVCFGFYRPLGLYTIFYKPSTYMNSTNECSMSIMIFYLFIYFLTWQCVFYFIHVFIYLFIFLQLGPYTQLDKIK